MRLIDADALEKEFCHGCKYENNKYVNCIDCAVANDPTVDAVPVDELKNRDVTFYDKGKAFDVFFPIGLDLDAVNRVKIRDREFVPVVRCKDCKYWERKDGLVIGYCGAAKHGYKSLSWDIGIYRTTMDTGYCSNGERRTDEAD